MRRSLASLVSVLALGAAALVAPPPAVAAPLGITLVHLRASSVDLKVVCVPDPPVNVLVYQGDHADLLGQTPIVCVGGGTEQNVTVPFTRTLTAGTRVDVSATVSGDGGEINAWFPNSLVEATGPTTPPDATVPSKPTRLHVRAGVHRLTLRWRVPATNGGAAIDRYRVWRRGHVFTVPASARTKTFFRLAAGTSYTLRVTAHNRTGPLGTCEDHRAHSQGEVRLAACGCGFGAGPELDRLADTG